MREQRQAETTLCTWHSQSQGLPALPPYPDSRHDLAPGPHIWTRPAIGAPGAVRVVSCKTTYRARQDPEDPWVFLYQRESNLVVSMLVVLVVGHRITTSPQPQSKHLTDRQNGSGAC